MTISKALKKLYTAMVGGTTTSTTAGAIINDIADGYVDSGDTLPAVTSDDNGDILKVVSGAWAKADGVTVDAAITEGGTNPVQGGAIFTALAGKQATLPSFTSEDAGKVLGIDEHGALEWKTLG